MKQIRSCQWILLLMLFLAACGSPELTPVATHAAELLGTETAVHTAIAQPTTPPLPEDTATTAATETAVASATPQPTTTPPLPTDTATAAATETAVASATQTLTPSPTNTPPPSATPTAANQAIAGLPNQIGQEVTVLGTVVSTASFAAGFKFILSDGTGQVTLLMWHNVYDDSWDAPKLNYGAQVRATGEVGVFEGELQIVPRFGGNVKVTAVGGSFATLRNIGDLGNHMGELVTITGQIVRVEGTTSGPRIFVSDDTGEVLVFIWNNILERVANNTSLGVAGTKVQIIGRVTEFRSNREVVPVLPYDVKVLP